MANFRRGADAIADAATRGTSKFAPTISFEAGETKYVQFLTSIEEVPTVLMHQWIIVGHREDGSEIFERFISRRDPALDGPNGYDELIDRFEQQPTQRCIALAIELKPQYGKGSGSRKTLVGFDIEERQFERDGETITVPAIGLIIESPFTFYTHLAQFEDVAPINETVFGVKRTGKSTDTTYTFLPTGQDALDLDEVVEEFYESFNPEEWLEDLADEDRMRELIGSLPDGAKVARYPSKKEKKGAKGGSRSTRARKTAEPEEEMNEPADEEKQEVRKQRFADLKKNVVKK